jgi:deferrochelatase/peroxidase EfeB
MVGTGRAEAGLLLIAYQRDLEEGFAAVQRRLAGERLGRYVLTVGGGYFFVPPPAPRRS